MGSISRIRIVVLSFFLSLSLRKELPLSSFFNWIWVIGWFFEWHLNIFFFLNSALWIYLQAAGVFPWKISRSYMHLVDAMSYFRILVGWNKWNVDVWLTLSSSSYCEWLGDRTLQKWHDVRCGWDHVIFLIRRIFLSEMIRNSCWVWWRHDFRKRLQPSSSFIQYCAFSYFFKAGTITLYTNVDLSIRIVSSCCMWEMFCTC